VTGRWRKNTRGAEKGKKTEGMKGGRWMDGHIIGKTIVEQEKKKKKKAMDLNGDWMDLFRKILLEQRGGKKKENDSRKEGGRWMGCRKNNHGTEKAKDLKE